MSQIKVTPQNMIRTASEIESKIGEWKQAVEKIYLLHAQMDGMWDGDANETFNAIFLEDKTKFQNLTAMMEEYAGAIRTAANNYIIGEEEAKNIVSRR